MGRMIGARPAKQVLGGGLLAALALVGAGLMAEGAPYDADGDGLVSLAELQVAMPEMSEEIFIAMDRDGRGALDAEEVAGAVEMGLLPQGA